MLFAVDVGNTNLTLGVFREKTLIGQWRLKTDPAQTVDGWGVLFRNLLSLAELSFAEIDGIIFSSVVPSLDWSVAQMAKRYFNQSALQVDSSVDTGMKILFENPKEVGADRIVNSVAALAAYGGPVVTVDFGTAVTFDVASAAGEYLGGVICPGVGVASEALFRRTARLPQIELARPAVLIGRSTVAGLQSGLYYGTLGLIDGLLDRLIAELGDETKVVATGGQSSVLGPASRRIQHVNEHLTLEGLRLIWERNR